MVAWRALEAHPAPTDNCQVRKGVFLGIKTSIPFLKAQEPSLGMQLTEEPTETECDGCEKVFWERSQGSLQ